MILLDGLNTDPEVIEDTMLWLKTHQIALEQVNLLPYHRLGQGKFDRLGMEVQTFATPDEATLERVQAQILRYYPVVTIGG
jgi:pyruvate formate lyase activating enzyme